MKTRLTCLAIATLLLGAPLASAGGYACWVRDIKKEAQLELSRATTTDLLRAAAAGDIEAAKRALKNGDTVNAATAVAKSQDIQTGRVTALMVAAARSKPEMVRWLIDRGAHVSGRDAKQQTALLYAVLADETENSIATVKALLRAGADPNLGPHQDLPLPLIATILGSKTTAAVLREPATAIATAKK